MAILGGALGLHTLDKVGKTLHKLAFSIHKQKKDLTYNFGFVGAKLG
jgi:hypothetical protein